MRDILKSNLATFQNRIELNSFHTKSSKPWLLEPLSRLRKLSIHIMTHSNGF